MVRQQKSKWIQQLVIPVPKTLKWKLEEAHFTLSRIVLDM